MKKVTLKFKKQDFLDSQYTNCADCAITRALKRAGYPQLEDAGIGILKVNSSYDVVLDNEAYRKLTQKVQEMYLNITKRKNFQITLPLDVE